MENRIVRRRTPWEIQRAVIAALVMRELKSRFLRHRLGFVMVLAEPLLHLFLVMMMFGYIRGHAADRLENFPVFLLVGIIPFLLFRNLTMRTMASGTGQRQLMSFRQIQPIDVILANAIIQLAISLFSCAVMLVLLGWLGFDVIPTAPLQWIGLMLLVVPLGIGLGLVLSVICRAVPEARIFIRMSFLPLYFLSGILHPLYMVPPEVAQWLLWNPLLRISELSRKSFFFNYPMPYDVGVDYVLFVTLLCLVGGLRAYRIRSQKSLHAEQFSSSEI